MPSPRLCSRLSAANYHERVDRSREVWSMQKIDESTGRFQAAWLSYEDYFLHCRLQFGCALNVRIEVSEGSFCRSEAQNENALEYRTAGFRRFMMRPRHPPSLSC